MSEKKMRRVNLMLLFSIISLIGIVSAIPHMFNQERKRELTYKSNKMEVSDILGLSL